MTTAVSVPDTLMQQAENAARLRGLSRDELIVEALSVYLQSEDRTDVRARFDAVYSKESSVLAPVIAQMQAQSLSQDEW